MHYTGTIWRPPYEASSLLLEVTAGCSHHKCKFCTLYNDLPFSLRVSPMKDIKADLAEAKEQYAGWSKRRVSRIFLTGANPFILAFEKLIQIAELTKLYFPQRTTIGCFARVTDITLKSDDELEKLAEAGYDGLTIGIETGDNDALAFMNKGYQASDIVEQCSRLDKVGITYSFFYLTSISGAGKGEKGALATAIVCNQVHPKLVGANMLTIYPDSELYEEIEKGNWVEEGEIEKYREIRTLVENLEIETQFAALGASNPIPVSGKLPQDKNKLIKALDKIIENESEEELQSYRRQLHHL